MDIAELKERYKAIPTMGRCAIVATLSLLVPVYLLFEDSSLLEQQLQEKRAQEQVARAKFESAKVKKTSLVSEQSQLTHYQDNLRQARKMLPDDFQIDEVLHTTATKSKAANIVLQQFRPNTTVATNSENGIRSQAIDLQFAGTFQEVAQFLDMMLHLDKLIHFQKFTLQGIDRQQAAAARGKSVNVTTEMTVYASTSQR